MKSNNKFVVVGARGLVGSGIHRALKGDAIAAKNIDWKTLSSFKSSFANVLKEIYKDNRTAQLHFIWAAGTANFQSDKISLINENDIFSNFLNILETSNIGSLTYTSSAGALYSEGRNTVCENSQLNNFSSYSESKILQEALLKDFFKAQGLPVVIARISSVYGIRNKKNSSQGIITNLIHANLIRKPSKIYVPLDLMRNYIHADTAGNKIRDLIYQVQGNNEFIVKIICSERSVSIREIIRMIDKISKHQTPYLISQSEVSELYDNFFCKSAIFPQIDLNNKDQLEFNIYNIFENLKQRIIFKGRLL